MASLSIIVTVYWYLGEYQVVYHLDIIAMVSVKVCFKV